MPEEKMNPEETEKETLTKEKNSNKQKDESDDLLESMMFSPTSGDADPIINIDKTTDDNVRDTKEQDVKVLLDILEKGSGELSQKYKDELLQEALKDPTSVMIKTPKGWRSMKEAIGDGYNLLTGDYTDEPIPKVDWEGEISKLDPREQETIRNLTQPGRRQAGPSKKPLPQEGMEQGGDIVPGPTGEPIPEQAQGQPATNQGAMGEALMGGTELPLGGM